MVVASGYADGPSQALIRFLDMHGATRVTAITHPLVNEGSGEHWVDDTEHGTTRARRIRKRPNRPPYTYLFDPVTPVLIPHADVWFGFNCLATAQGLVRRRFGRVTRVVHWSVDFVPERFGTSPLTRLYDWLDKRCVTSSDARVELSEAAYDGRLARYGLTRATCPAVVIPMGAWIDESPLARASNLLTPRLVFLGHLVERMGVPLVLDLADELRRRGRGVPIDVIGGGPQLDELRQSARDRDLAAMVMFHGFLPDFSDVQQLLARASVALAPYELDESSFSRFADPGKLKGYLGAGLPVLLTPVPPNAHDLAAEGGAQIVDADPVAFADAVVNLLDDHGEWTRRFDAARSYAKSFDWETMLTEALPRLGISVDEVH